jgi:Asp-tRNA(Asn)/Glu-tRNA(Gln) amidotransferase C subunit
MAISREQLEHLAKLSALQLSDEELEHLGKDLKSII